MRTKFRVSGSRDIVAEEDEEVDAVDVAISAVVEGAATTVGVGVDMAKTIPFIVAASWRAAIALGVVRGRITAVALSLI